ncbi:DUF4912 domain-containing protein [Leptothermofonsia sp. ETS-13]|uniref:DUF4912 domain-containing protein n=1 Tax=Leptothermofonsia sp. ETS-13 TaxID=3035696 RepID=UPI003B9F8B9E
MLALTAAFEPFVQSFFSTNPALAQSPTPSLSVPPVTPQNQMVRVDGSTSMKTINQVLKEKYEAKYPGTAVEFTYSGTPAAIQALLNGKADLAAIGRALTDAEKAQGLKQVVVTRHKIAIVVGPDNPFSGSLEDRQFAQIFRGEITDWSQVGGTPGPIRFIDRPEESDTRQAFQNYPVFKSASFEVTPDAVKVEEDSTEAILKELGSDGISYAIADQVVDQPGVRVLPMHKTLPDDPRYPFSQPLVYVYKDASSPAVRQFLLVAGAPENDLAIEEAREEGAIAQATPSPDATSAPVSPEPPTEPATAPTEPADPALLRTNWGSISHFTDGSVSPWLWLLLLPLLLLGWLGLRSKGRRMADGTLPPPLEAATPPAVPPAPPEVVPPVVPSPAETPPVSPVPGVTPPEATVGAVPDATVPTRPGGIDMGLAAGAVAAGAGAAATAGLVGDKSAARSQITLTPRGHHQAYAHWELTDDHKAEIQAQGGENLMLRLYDVTGLDPETRTPHSTEEFDVADWSWDRNLPIPEYNRDYVAEVGYLTADGRWLSMARSNSVRVAPPTYSDEEVVVDAPKIDPALAGATLAAGAGAIAMAARDSDDQSNVEAAKFDVGQTDLSSEELASVDKGLADLPDGYGESRIVLMPRDPQWAYAYWDTPNEHKEEVRRQGGQKLALRIYDVTDIDLSYQAPHSLQQYDCDEMARDWYVPIPVSDRDYIAEIGYLTADGRWLMLARSSPCRIPPVFPSDWYEDHFATIDWNEDLRGKTFATLIPPGRRVATGNPIYDQIFGMAESAEAMRVAGSLFGSMQHVPGSVFGSMQMASGAAISSYVFSSGVGVVPGVPTLSGLTMSGVGFSASMPPIRARKFWLVADAELIIYGATEPDATVTIAGRPIQLNPDGTFRFQMSFQDGLLDFPIMAVAADGEQNRSIHMKFVRETPFRQTNTKEEAQEEEY